MHLTQDLTSCAYISSAPSGLWFVSEVTASSTLKSLLVVLGGAYGKLAVKPRYPLEFLINLGTH